ncbi:MAG: N-acetyltransferase [Alphaproteobacteria bacterium]|nr:N-acetyltransferase [Alphaproteobacteria bacterium]
MSLTPPRYALRKARFEDVAAIQAIYAHHVLNGLGTFEEVPPDAAEMAERLAEVTGQGFPWFVAEADDGEILGYAYAAPFRARSAYRFTVEDSVYVAPARTRRGVGLSLLTALINSCTEMGCRQMLAAIGDTDNKASIGLHSALGFGMAGTLEAVGYKHGRWVDVVLMQRGLGQYPTLLPPPAGR